MTLKTVFLVRYWYRHGGGGVSIINRKEYELMTIWDNIEDAKLDVWIDEEYEVEFDESIYSS